MPAAARLISFLSSRHARQRISLPATLDYWLYSFDIVCHLSYCLIFAAATSSLSFAMSSSIGFHLVRYIEPSH